MGADDDDDIPATQPILPFLLEGNYLSLMLFFVKLKCACCKQAFTVEVFFKYISDVVAYVEVRSGHDNRSRGVKTQLRNLGATIVDNLTNNVSTTVFIAIVLNESFSSRYIEVNTNCYSGHTRNI